jgi:putative DNA primase/helicase
MTDNKQTKKVTCSLRSNVNQALESICYLPSEVKQPCWLGDSAPFDMSQAFALKNGLLDLSAATSQAVKLHPPTPLFFSTNGVDYEYNQGARCDHWLKFQESVWGDDPESIATLQEWFGYCLTPETGQQKLVMMIGPKRSGKGTIADVLSQVVGSSNVAAPTLSSLPGQFGLWPLIGKSLAIIGDARLSGRVDSVSVVERLLSITGEDLQNVDRKHLTPLIGIRLPIRFLILSNELPNLHDASGAIMSRVLLFKMTRSFYGKEDRSLRQKLAGELPGILNWAIEGRKRLHDRGHFVEPQSSRELVNDLSRIASPVDEFVSECCIVGPEFSVAAKTLYANWKEWCHEHGRDHPGSDATFGKNIRAAVPSLQRVKRATAPGSQTRSWMYMGIGLKSAELGTAPQQSQDTPTAALYSELPWE